MNLLSTLTLVKSRYTAKAFLNNRELLIYGDIHYFTNSGAKNSQSSEFNFSYNCFLFLSAVYIFTAYEVQKNTPVEVCIYLFILPSVYGITRCPPADQRLPKLRGPHVTLNRPVTEIPS
jgi:hypothetical protein